MIINLTKRTIRYLQYQLSELSSKSDMNDGGIDF